MKSLYNDKKVENSIVNNEIQFSYGGFDINIFSKLIKKEIDIYVIKNFISEFERSYMLSNFKSLELEKYEHEVVENDERKFLYFGVDRFGVPFNSVYGKSLSSKERLLYYNSIKENVFKSRSLFYNKITPIDKLRVLLEDNYDKEVNLGRFEGKKMFSGILRNMHAKLSHFSEEEPHFDFLPSKYEPLKDQFAANVYLKMPSSGGMLEVYSKKIDDENYEPPKNWRGELLKDGFTPLFYTPQEGDLVLFSTRQPHAITSFENGQRVSMQTFLGLKNDNKLVMWN